MRRRSFRNAIPSVLDLMSEEECTELMEWMPETLGIFSAE